jgi:hypothetical protein
VETFLFLASCCSAIWLLLRRTLVLQQFYAAVFLAKTQRRKAIKELEIFVSLREIKKLHKKSLPVKGRL